MNIHNSIHHIEPAPYTILMAMIPGYTNRSQMITVCFDAIPELFGNRTEGIAMEHMEKHYPGTAYTLISSTDWAELPE